MSASVMYKAVLACIALSFACDRFSGAIRFE